MDSTGKFVDINESSGADLPPVGTTRITRRGGQTQQSIDGAPWVPVGTTPPASSISTAFARAQALLGTSINRYGGTDFDTDQDYTVTNAGTGTSVLSQTAKAGVLVMSSGASANGSTTINPHGAPSIIDNGRTTPWYLYVRGALGTAVDAAAYLATCQLGSTSRGSPAYALGGLGFLSTGFFSMYAQTNGGATAVSAVSTVPLDLLYHDLELWNDGATIFAAIDKVTFTSQANTTNGPAPLMWLPQALNGATAAARSQSLDLLFWATSGN